MDNVVSRRIRPLFWSALLCFGIVLLGILSANFFPDQTWDVLTSVEKQYAEIVSRMRPVPTGADRSAEEARIDEAIFRYFLQSKVEDPVFLSVDDKDPTDDLMARLATSGKPVRKGSEAHFDGTSIRLEGVLLSATSVKWLFGDRVEIGATLTCGPLCGEGGVYVLVKKRGRWTVEECKEHWVS
jgi:hypothetical protein